MPRKQAVPKTTGVNVTLSGKILLRQFYRLVCMKAEANMEKTGTLEGSHYAAMKQVLSELGVKVE